MSALGSVDSSLLRELISYDPETGNCTWRVRSVHLFEDDTLKTAGERCAIWNGLFAGIEVGSLNCQGYRRTVIGGKLFYLHRIIFSIVMGRWPTVFVDHRNGDRLDNRWSNLREASRSQNLQNSPLRANSRSGFKGVFWDGQYGKWHARINISGRPKYLGRFDRAADAHAAYVRAAVRYFGEFARTA